MFTRWKLHHPYFPGSSYRPGAAHPHHPDAFLKAFLGQAHELPWLWMVFVGLLVLGAVLASVLTLPMAGGGWQGLGE